MGGHQFLPLVVGLLETAPAPCHVRLGHGFEPRELVADAAPDVLDLVGRYFEAAVEVFEAAFDPADEDGLAGAVVAFAVSPNADEVVVVDPCLPPCCG